MAMSDEGPKEACKTYIEQTKLLVTLASAFVVAPVALIPYLNGTGQGHAPIKNMTWLLYAEGGFILSIFAGYVVLATLAGYQQRNIFNVNRLATKISSLAQIVTYIAGLGLFVRVLQL